MDIKNREKREWRVFWITVVGLVACTAALIGFSPTAASNEDTRPKVVYENPVVIPGRTLGPCYDITEEVNWREAPRGRAPLSGEAHAVDLNITFYETSAELVELQRELFGDHVANRAGILYGFTYKRASTPGICYVATLRPDTVDGRNMCWLGHEVLHCIAGGYHR